MKFSTMNILGSVLATVSFTVFPASGEATPVSITWPILGASHMKFTPSGFVNHFASSLTGISGPVTWNTLYVRGKAAGVYREQEKRADRTCIEPTIRIHHHLHLSGIM